MNLPRLILIPIVLLLIWQSSYGQCNVDPSWIIEPSDLNITLYSSDFGQGVLCPGTDPIIDSVDGGTPEAAPNDPSADCNLSDLTISFQDTYSSSDPSNDCITIIERLWKATYAQANGGTGNVSGIQEIIIEDDVEPTLGCPSNLDIDLISACDENDPNVLSQSGFAYGSGSGISEFDFENFTDGSVFDNCDTDLQLEYSDGLVTIDAGACPGAFMYWTRTWTVTDNCGQTAQCEQLISLFDASLPIFTSSLPDFDENMMITACDVNDPNIELITGYPFNDVGATSVGQDEIEALGGFVEDNCKDQFGLTYSYIDIYFDFPGNCPGEIGQIFRVWSAMDHCGNVEIDRQEIFLFDNVGPEITTCPADVQIEIFSPEVCDQNNPQIEVLTGFAFSFLATILDDPNNFPGSAEDNCDGSSWSDVGYIDQVTQFECESGSNVAFEITRTWMVADACGNITECEQLIQLLDNEAPVLIDGASFFYNQDYSNSVPMVFETVACEQVVAWTDPSPADILDNCESFDNLVIWKSHESPHLFRDGTTEVTYVFRDNCGNQTEVVWDVTVVCVACTPQNIYFLCSQPPTICDFAEVNTFSSCTPEPIGPEPNFYLCGDEQFLDNPSYLEFVAGEEEISIIYLIENCVNDAGLEIVVTDPCDPLSCYNQDKVECVNGFGNVLAWNLTVGNIYQIIVDGCMGDQCEYTISINTGPFELPDFQSAPTDVTSLTSLSCHPNDLRFCVGQQVAFHPEDFGDASFNFCWSIDNQNGVEVLNNQPNCGQAVVPTPQGLTFECSNDYSTCGPLEIQFNETGTYHICLIEVENGCDHADLTDYCWDITVVPNGPVDFGTYYVCQSEMPWFVDVEGPNGEAWPGPPMNEGTETIVNTDFCGCTYEYMIDVRTIPESQGEGDIRVCFADREDWQDPVLDLDWEDIMNDYVPAAMGSEISFDNGSALINYEGVYCDTVIFYNVFIYDVHGVIISSPGSACDQILSFEIDSLLFPEFMDEDELEFVWTDATGTTVDVGPTISVEVDGIYTLTVEYELDEFTLCDYIFTQSVSLGTQMPAEPTFVLAPQQTCPDAIDNLIFSVPVSSQANYVWIVANGTFVGNASGEQITVSVTDPSLPLSVSVYSTSMCGQSPTATTFLNVVPAPEVELTQLTDVCINENTNLVSSILQGTVDDYFWIIDDVNANWTMIGSNNQSSIEVSWPTPGIKTFSLYVEDPGGCESAIVSGQINVVEALNPPSVMCSETTTTSVTISWQDDALGEGTSVNVISGQTGVENANEYVVDNLTAGEIVSFELVTLGLNHPCGNSIAVPIDCEASACNLNPIIETPENDICLDGANLPFQLEETTGIQGGVWSGIGVVSDDGFFDPNVSGAGQFQITYIIEDLILGCTASEMLTITVFPNPMEDFTLSVDTVCLEELLTVGFQNTSGLNYDWDFDTGSSNPAINSNSFELSYSSPGDKILSLEISSDTDCHYTVEYPIYVRPPLQLAGVFCIANTTNSVEFSWPDNSDVEFYGIVATIGNDTIGEVETDDNYFGLFGIDEGDVVMIEVTAIDQNGCEDAIAIGDCTAQECPGLDVVLSSDATILCWDPTGLDVQLFEEVIDETGIPVASNGNWFGPFVDPITGVLNPDGPGVYTVFYTHTDPTTQCSSTGELVINIIEEPISEFSLSEDVICVSNELTITYNGDYDSNIMFDWSSDLDPSVYTLIDNDNGTFTVVFFQGATGEFSLQTIVGDCSSVISTQSIAIDAFPELPSIECETTLSSVLFYWESPDCAVGYNVFIDGVDQGEQQDTFILIDNLAVSSMVDIEVELISDCLCDFQSSIFNSCNAQDCQPAVIDFGASFQTEFCESDIPQPFELELSINGSQITNSGTWQWTGNYINQNGFVDLAGAPLGNHTINVTYEEGDCVYQKFLTFKILETPEGLLSVFNPLCPESEFGLAGIFVVEVMPETPEIMIEIDGNELNDGELLPLEPGSYELLLTHSSGCTNIYDFEIETPSEPFGELVGPGFIKTDSIGLFEFDLDVKPDNLSWFLNDDLIQEIDCSIEDCAEFQIVPDIPGEYELCVIANYADECEVTACYNYVVGSIAITNIFVPNIFDPQSDDDENNSLNIYVVGFDLVVDGISVYDRWGNVVFANSNEFLVSSGDKLELWDGDFGDTEYLPGVYVYKVDYIIDGQREYLVGDISIFK